MKKNSLKILNILKKFNKFNIFNILSFIFLLSLTTNTFIKAAEIKFTDNHRIYEPININKVNGIEISANNSIDFSKADETQNTLRGTFKGLYNIKAIKEAKKLHLGFTFTSNLIELDKFFIRMGKENLKYKIKFLNNRYLNPTGEEFYKEISKEVNTEFYNPVHFKKDGNGLLRTFKLESKDSEKLVYEINISYNPKNSKLFATGGKNITNSSEKENKILKIIHELGGNYKTPQLYVIGDNVLVNTRILVNGKEISSGFTETIDKKTMPVISYIKENLLNEIPDKIKQNLTDENIFELFGETFDKILSGANQDTSGILNAKTPKQILITTEEITVDTSGKDIEITYPVFAGVTTIENNDLLKLNTEISPLETFEKLSKLEYSITGTEKYKLIASSDVDYETKDNVSTFSISKLSKKLISSMLYKESYLKGVSKLQPNKHTNKLIMIFGMVEIIGIIYLKEKYLSPRKAKKKNKKTT